jgi:SAM-dependent methyltransferase
MNPDGVQAAYDAWAATYDEDRNLTPFTTGIIKGQRLRLSGACVVEIGCGTGANTVWLAEAAERVIALDFSDRMLEQARRRATSKRVRFLRHDVSEPWPIPDQSADLVLDSLVRRIRHYPPKTGGDLATLDDPSQITDFDGVICDSRIFGTGTATDLKSGRTDRCPFTAEMGIMRDA